MQLHFGLCVPCELDGYTTHFERSVKALKGMQYTFEKRVGPNMVNNRNDVVTRGAGDAVKPQLPPFEFFIGGDADIEFRQEHIEQLLARKKPVVSAAYNRREANSNAIHAGFWAIPGVMKSELSTEASGLIQTNWVGGGLIAIHRSVFEKAPYPWWEAVMIEWAVKEQRYRRAMSADWGFCYNAQAAGIPIMVDCDCRVYHHAGPFVSLAECEVAKAPEQDPQPVTRSERRRKRE